MPGLEIFGKVTEFEVELYNFVKDLLFLLHNRGEAESLSPSGKSSSHVEKSSSDVKKDEGNSDDEGDEGNSGNVACTGLM